MKKIRHLSCSWCSRPALLSAIGLVLLLVLAGCGGEDPPPAAATEGSRQKALPVKTETVEKAPLVLTLDLTGVVEAARIAQLASPAEGPVVNVRVREGDRVRPGQVLLTLGRAAGANAIARSLGEDMKKEEDNLARTRRLVETGALPGEQLDIALAATERVRAQWVKAQETAADFAIAAPWAGVVSKMKVHDGDIVAPRAPLAEIYDPQSLIVRIAVPEQDAAGLQQGMRAAIELDAHPGRQFPGTVVRRYPTLDPRTRTRTAEIAIDAPPELLPGMFARVSLVLAKIPDAVTVPAHSLVTSPGGGAAVFVLQEGKAVRRTVETGAESGDRIRILAGLAEGETLIVAGHEKLKDGATVQAAGTPAGKQKATGASQASAGIAGGNG